MDKPFRGGYCTRCGVTKRHSHTNTNKYTSPSGSVHTHGVSGQTGYADQTGTPENHVHPFNISTGGGDLHGHAGGGYTDTNPCSQGNNHAHGLPSSLSSTNHLHTLSGNSGTGGESPTPTAGPRMLGDGLSWIVV